MEEVLPNVGSILGEEDPMPLATLKLLAAILGECPEMAHTLDK
jgi:hypothetical protein